jgi:hypothetical protein
MTGKARLEIWPINRYAYATSPLPASSDVQAKYGIVDDDIYNFDETGFMMGIIFPGMVVTTLDGRGKAKLAQPGNRE